MSNTGWTPVDEKAAAPAQGWTPVQQPPAPEQVAAAQQNKPNVQQPESPVKQIARGATLGAFSGLGIPETQTPVQDLGRNLGTRQPSDAMAAFDPTGGALTQGINMVKGMWGAGKEMKQGVEQNDREMTAHGGASLLTQVLMLKGIASKGGEAPLDALAEDAKNFDRHTVALDNSWRFGGHKMLQDAMSRVKAQVGQYADQIKQADTASNQARGGLGSHTAVDAYKILDDSIKQRNPAEMPRSAEAQKLLMDVTGGLQDWGTMQKYRTEVGKLWREASKRADNTGEGRADAAATGAAYRSLTNEMQQGAERVGHGDTFKEYNKLNTQYERAQSGPLGQALDNDPNPLRDRNSNGSEFWGHLFSKADQAQLHESLADLQKGQYLDPSFIKLRNELRPVMDAVKGSGRVDFKQRLAMAGLFTAVGVPHAFLSAYTAMYFPELAKVFKAARTERMIGNSLPSSLPQGDWFSPPKQPGSAPQAPPPQAGSGEPARAPAQGGARVSPSAPGNDVSLLSNPEVLKAIMQGRQTNTMPIPADMRDALLSNVQRKVEAKGAVQRADRAGAEDVANAQRAKKGKQ